MNISKPMAISPHQVSKIFLKAYPKCDILSKYIVRFRPYICPFHELIESVPVSRSILDVGCGIGLMTVLLTHLGKVNRAVGIDISPKAINIARSAAIPQKCDASFHSLSEDDPWPNQEFDTVVCIDAFHHVPCNKQRDFIKKLARASFGGTLVFKDISPSPFWKAFASIVHDLFINRQWINLRPEKEVQAWFQEEGLTILEYRRMDTLWYSHYLLIAEQKIPQ